MDSVLSTSKTNLHFETLDTGHFKAAIVLDSDADFFCAEVRKTLNCLYVPSIDIKLAIISPSHYQ
jgi:hypothetical protein